MYDGNKVVSLRVASRIDSLEVPNEVQGRIYSVRKSAETGVCITLPTLKCAAKDVLMRGWFTWSGVKP